VTVTRTPDGCPVCGSDRRTSVTKQNELQVVGCERCGQRFVWPVPSQVVLDAIYDRNYYRGGCGSVGFSDYDALGHARRRMFSHHLDRIERVRRPGRVLDVGCATGDFLLVARDRGWDPLGVDPSPAREQAAAASLPIVGHTIHDAQVAPHSLDLVTFWDVLEHVPDPVGDLRRAAELLLPDGLIAATVPNAGGAVARLSGRRWFGYKVAGEHLQFFTAETLTGAFVAAGFDLQVRRDVTWSCTVGFVVDRAALYLGPAGRLLKRVLSDTQLGARIIDVPMVNQFAIARRAVALPGRLAA